MDNKTLENAINTNNSNSFKLDKFKIEGLDISECIVEKIKVDEKFHYVIRPINNKRKKKYLWQCQFCDRFFLGKKDSEGKYLGNCFHYKNFDDEERKGFYDSFFKSGANITEKERIAIADLLDEIGKGKRSKKAGVWALWCNNKCIQVAKNKDIYGEIFNNFKKEKGTINYSEYKEKGKIAILSTDESDSLIEAQYAHDNRAKFWKPSFFETKMIGEKKTSSKS